MKFLVIIFMMILAISGIGYFFKSGVYYKSLNPSNQPSPIGAGTATTTTAPRQVHTLGKTDQQYIDQAITYLKNRLGSKYYSQFLSVKTQGSISTQICQKENCQIYNTVLFDQKIPMEHYVESNGPVARDQLSTITVSLSNLGNILQYDGPKKQYQFNLSKSDILERARSYGIDSISQSGVTDINKSPDGYDIVWKVENDKNGVMIDPDNGTLVGHYTPYRCQGMCPM